MKRWLKYLTDIFHVAAGFLAAKLGLGLEATILYASYETMQAYIEARASGLLAEIKSRETYAAWLENIADMYGAVKELREDMLEFGAGLFIGVLL